MKIKNFSVFLLLIAALSSCIKDDLSGCYSTNRLILSYFGDGVTEIFNNSIDRVEMYVFDESNQCVASMRLTPEEIATRSVELPKLPNGNYRIICVGNTYNTRIEGIESGRYDYMRFASNDYHNQNRLTTNDCLYYASLSLTITSEDQEETIRFASSHYKLIIEVAGLAPEGNVGLPSLEMCGLPSHTDFENAVCGETVTHYLETELNTEKGLLFSQSYIMRLTDLENANLYLRDVDGQLINGGTVNLAQFVADHPEVDLSLHEAIIPIRIEFKAAEVLVTIPDWFIENMKPDFDKN